MKRYTLQFHPLDERITTTELRDELEPILLRLHPRITYRLGRVYKDIYGKLIAEMAMDGERRLLDEALKSKEWVIPIEYERLRWGWYIDNEDAELLISGKDARNSDPLAGVSPLDGTGEFILSKRILRGRYVALMLSTLALILVMAANIFRTNSTLLEVLYIVFFAIFLFTLNDTPLDIRVYAERIAILPLNLEVSFWLLRKPVSLQWDKIWGLEYTNPVCTVRSEGSKTRFLMSERFGCKEKSVIMKTIVKRASLSFVEGNFQNLIYRKPDAGETN